MKNLKSSIDNSVEDSANILASAVINEQSKLKILYRIMNLIDDTSLTSDERIDLAFRYDADEEHIKKGMELFNSYARGGIEWIYDEITQNAATNDDYLGKLANLVKDFSQDYEDSFNS